MTESMIINSREQMLVAIGDALGNKIEAPSSIEFNEDLLSFSIKIFEGDDHSIITTEMMQAFLLYEHRLIRSYKLLKYGSFSAKLTEQEKAILTLRIKVEDGCTKQYIEDLKGILVLLNSLYDNIMLDMSPNKKFAMFMSIMALGLGYIVSDAITHVSDNEAKTAQSTSDNKLIESVITRALQQHEESEKLLDDSVKYERALNKGLSNAEKVILQGEEVYAPPFKQTRTKPKLINKQLNGEYNIKSFDFNAQAMRAKIESVKSGQLFYADFDELIKDPEHQNIFLRHAVDRTPLYLYVNATFNGATLKEAVIVDYSLEGENDGLKDL